MDYLEIIGGSATCGGNVFVDRFCGQKLGSAEASATGTGKVCGMLQYLQHINKYLFNEMNPIFLKIFNFFRLFISIHSNIYY